MTLLDTGDYYGKRAGRRVTEAPLTFERILEAAQDVLRRYGPGKTTGFDVARELGVSHGSVYCHFPSNAALRDPVAERWLHSISGPARAATCTAVRARRAP